MVPKASGSFCPVIDLFFLNKYVITTKFRMETMRTVLASIKRGNWMVSVDLKDAYLQVPIHPLSRRYLRFGWRSPALQFRVLCFGLSTAPQVFTKIMALISSALHRRGIWMTLMTFAYPSGARSPLSHEKPTTSSSLSLVQHNSRRHRSCSVDSRPSPRSPVVGTGIQPSRWPSSPRGVSRFPVVHRHFNGGMGLLSPATLCRRVAVRGRSCFSHQPPGDEGRQARSSLFRVPSMGQESRGIRRQHHSPCLHDTSRRDSFFVPQLRGAADSALGKGQVHHLKDSVHQGHSQRGGGFPQQEAPGYF